MSNIKVDPQRNIDRAKGYAEGRTDTLKAVREAIEVLYITHDVSGNEAVYKKNLLQALTKMEETA